MTATISSTSVVGPAPGVIAQPVPQGVLLLDMASGEYFSLEETGGRVWVLCDGQRSAHDVAVTLADEYDVEVAVVSEDVVELLTDMIDAGLLVLV